MARLTTHFSFLRSVFLLSAAGLPIWANPGREANTGTSDPRSAETKVVEMLITIDLLVRRVINTIAFDS